MDQVIEKVVGAYNKSTTYLMPLLSSVVPNLYPYAIVNTYVGFEPALEEIEHPFGILYDIEAFPDAERYSDFNLEMESSQLFYNSFMHNDGQSKLYVFYFPVQFIPDYCKFMIGQYSKLSQEAKSLILTYLTMQYKYPPMIVEVSGVLNKSKARKVKLEKQLAMSIPDDVELASKIDIEKETFKFEV
jgi:hypothetical protein